MAAKLVAVKRFESIAILFVWAGLCASVALAQEPEPKTPPTNPEPSEQLPAAAVEGAAEGGSEAPEDPADLPPPSGFEILREMAIPGPLSEVGAILDGERILLLAKGGETVAHWDPATGISLDPPSDETRLLLETPPTAATWGYSPDRRLRARVDDKNRLVLQKSCKRCSSGWRRKWRTRLPAGASAPPLVLDKSVYIGLLDNRIYAFKRRNGHRLWEADMGRRLLRRLVQFDAVEGSPRPPMLLALPGAGKELIAIDRQTGVMISKFQLSGDGALVGTPVPFSPGQIAIAHQRYRFEDASLMLLKLRSPEDKASDGPNPPEMTYNGPTLNAPKSSPK